MISFSIENYISYCLSALIYGVVFSFFVCFAPFLKELVSDLFFYLSKCIFYSGSLRKLDFPKRKNTSQKTVATLFSEVFSAISVIIFALGFIIVSYYEMDGSSRLFAVVLSLISFMIFKSYVFPHVLGVIKRFILSVLRLSALLIRYLTYPLHAVILYFFAKIVKKHKLNRYFSYIYRAIAIDNGNN